MLVVVGFAIGYVMGAKAGEEGLERVVDSAKHVLASDEFKSGVETAKSLAGAVLREGFGRIAGRAAGEAKEFTGRLRVA